MDLSEIISSYFAPSELGPAEPALDEPRGASGRYNTSGFLQWDELNVDLQGRAGIHVFDKMYRTDADIRRALTICFTPIVNATATVEPYDGGEEDPTTDQDREIAAMVEWNLMQHMRPKFKAHTWTALTVGGRSGFAPFEKVYEHAQWRGRDVMALKTLDLRLPRSVYRWPQDAGVLLGIEQFALPNAPTPLGKTIPINAQNLVYYRFGAEGDNWDGTSLLRPAYKHWKYKDGVELIEAIGIEKFAIGTPVGYPPRAATDRQLDQFEAALANWRANEQQYILMPGPKQSNLSDGEGWEVEIVVPHESRGASSGIEDARNYHSDKIASIVIAEFMRQGMAGTSGTNAASSTQQDPFLSFCELLAGLYVEDVHNEQTIPALVDLNYTVAPGRYPRLKLEVIDDTSLEELGKYVAALANVGAIRVEPTLEEYLRKVADLPPADEDALAEVEAAKAEQAQQAADMVRKGMVLGPDGKPTQMAPNPQPQPDAKPGKPPAKQQLDIFTLARREGPLKPHEQHMSLDRIESAIDDARARFQQGPGQQARIMAQGIARQPAPRHGTPPRDLVQAVQTELRALYQTGQHTVVEELARQRSGSPPVDPTTVTLAAADLGPRFRKLQARAHTIASNVRAAVVTAVSKQLLGRNTGPADLQLAAEAAATGALRSAAIENAAAALNAGRNDQAAAMSDQIEGARYTSVLDGNTCENCAGADDDVLRPLDDPVLMAEEPPNPQCDGGERCRCMLAYELASQIAPDA